MNQNKIVNKIVNKIEYDNNKSLKIEDTTQPILLLVIIIWIITVITQLGSLAYSTLSNGNNFQTVIAQSIFFLSLFTIPLSWSGIWLGRQIGLGTPLLYALILKKPGSIRIMFKDIKLAIVLGLLTGGAMVLLRMITEPYLPSELPTFGHRGILGGLLVSLGAAVGEEVWFRLGLMTIILWFVSRIMGHTRIQSSVAWITIILVAMIFGAIHLPQLISYGAGSSFAIWGTIIGNSVVGILYGWFYWRRSLIAAIVAHFSVDLVIHVFPVFYS